MKKLLILTLMASSSYASQHNGAYVGLGVGQTSMFGTLTKKNRFLDETNTKLGNSHVTPKVFLGYGGLIGDTPFYVGADVFFSYTNINSSASKKIKLTGFNSVVKILHRNTSGAAINIGYTWNGFLGYGRIGLVSSNYKFQYDEDNITLARKDANKNGKLFGAGVSYIACPKWRIGIEYNYTHYEESNLQTARNWTFKFMPKTHATYIKLAYIL